MRSRAFARFTRTRVIAGFKARAALPELDRFGEISALHLIRAESGGRRILALVHSPDLLVKRKCVRIIFGIAVKLGEVRECLCIGGPLLRSLLQQWKRAFTIRGVVVPQCDHCVGQCQIARRGGVRRVRHQFGSLTPERAAEPEGLRRIE